MSLIKNYFESKRIWYIFISITNISKYNYSSSYSKEIKDLVFPTKTIFFEQIRNKYPSLFKKSNYPLSNIFINNLLKDEKSYLSTFSIYFQI